MLREGTGYRIRTETVEEERIPEDFDGFRMLFITDIHRRRLSERALQRKIAGADIILLGGDLTEKGVPWKRLEKNMNILTRMAPVYAVLGNHDWKAGRGRVESILGRAGVTLLKDDTVTLRRHHSAISLSGIMQPRSRKHPYSKYKGPRNRSFYHIILVHDPIWIHNRQRIPADLVLAGHTHGGQIILPLFGAVKLEGFYKFYGSGWFDLRGKGTPEAPGIKMLISRGFGNSHIPFRLGSPAELHLITLRHKRESA